MTQAQIFQRLDNNGDGVITRDETPSQTAFNRADANGDGRITREEFSRHSQRPSVERATGNLDGPLPRDTSQAKTDFQLVYVHNGRIAQASAILNAFGKDGTDLLIASKRLGSPSSQRRWTVCPRRHVRSGQCKRVGIARL